MVRDNLYYDLQWRVRFLFASGLIQIVGPEAYFFLFCCPGSNNLWAEKELTFEHLDKVERNLLEKRVPEYSYLWDSLTLNQRKTLKLIARTTGKNIFAEENLDRFGFRTASQVVASLAGLEKMGILNKNKEWKIHDPFFQDGFYYPD